MKKVTQNNTGMYTKESSQQTWKIPNNNYDARFGKVDQKNYTTYHKVEQDKTQFMMVKF